jgi:hypothetical protein
MSHSSFRVPAALLATLVAGSLLGTATAPAQQIVAASDDSRTLASAVAPGSSERSAKPDLSRARAVAVWQGPLKGGGAVTFTLERLGRPDNLSDPAWPVQTHWTINSPEPGRSFTAELFGWMRDNGSMRLAGIVTDGYKKGAEIHIDRRGGTKAPEVRISSLRASR